MGIGNLDFWRKVLSLLRGGSATPEEIRELIWQGYDLLGFVLNRFYPRPGVYGSESLEFTAEEIALIREIAAELEEPTGNYGARGVLASKLIDVIKQILPLILPLIL